MSDANDLELLERAYETFLETHDRPTLIIVDSHIAWGAPHKQDTHGAHGEPLGEDEVRLTKKFYGWPEDAKFLVPEGVYDHFKQGIGRRGKELRDAWFARLKQYKAKYPELALHLDQMQHRRLPDGWDKGLPTYPADPKGIATRISTGEVRLRGRQLRRAESPFRDSRTRDGGDSQRHVHGQGPALRRWIPDLQRLRPGTDSISRHHGVAGHLRIHA